MTAVLPARGKNGDNTGWVRFKSPIATEPGQIQVAVDNELSAERRRPVLTENQVRAMIGGGVEKPVERAFGAVGDSRRSRRAVSQRWT